MPNGTPHWEKKLPKVEIFFGKISKVLEDFANDHNLLIGKYYRQWPAWTFIFRHPKGGSGKIEVEKAGSRSVIVRSSWYIVNFENSTWFVREPKGVKCSLSHDALLRVLEDTFQQIISWEKDDLKAVKSKHYNGCKQYVKEEYEEQLNKYPVPKL